MLKSVLIVLVFLSISNCASLQSFMSSDGDGFTISTSPIQVISSKPVEIYNYVINGINYYITSATKLTIDQVKEKLNNLSQQQQQMNEQKDKAMEEANKAMQSVKDMFANIHQNIQNQFGFLNQRLTKKRDVVLTISPIYDPTVTFLPVHTYVYNNNGTKLYLTSTKSLNDTQIQEAVESFKQRYNDEKKLSEQIYSNVLAMNQKIIDLQNQYVLQFQKQMQNFTSQIYDYQKKINDTTYFSLF